MSTTRTLAKIGTATTIGVLGVCVSAGAAFACNMSDGSSVASARTVSATSTAPATAATFSARNLLSMAQGFEHGEFTMTTPTGPEVVDVQAGTVTTVAPTSVTVTSADGFVGTYVLATSTKIEGNVHGSKDSKNQVAITLKTGDKVDVVALKSTGVVQVANDLSAKTVNNFNNSHKSSTDGAKSGKSSADWSARGFKH
jgi:hypothetical protein